MRQRALTHIQTNSPLDFRLKRARHRDRSPELDASDAISEKVLSLSTAHATNEGKSLLICSPARPPPPLAILFPALAQEINVCLAKLSADRREPDAYSDDGSRVNAERGKRNIASVSSPRDLR